MDARNTDIVTQRLHQLLARLSTENLKSNPSQKQNLLTSAHKYQYPHRRPERRAWSRDTSDILPKILKQHIRDPTMGVKGTDDYLTARAANPRTGLISPSVVTNLTPRTPISPAEALSLFGTDHEPPRISTPKARMPEEPRAAIQRPRPAGPRGRWRQDSTGWNMELDTEAGSSRANTPNPPATRADFHASEDSFVIPMPTAKDPQPYRQEDQDKAVQYYKDKAQRLSHKEGMNGRMHSIGAGPRKFAQATKALRDFSNPQSPTPDEEDTITRKEKATSSSPPMSAVSGFSSCESSLERRDSAKETLTSKSPTLGGAERTRSNSNASRFQDLRQLPRTQHEKTAPVPREYNSTPPPPYRTHPNTPSLSGTSVAESLSPLETQVVGFLAWAINQLFYKPTSSTRDGSPQGQSIGIVQAIHILSDSTTKPIERWQAIKALAFVASRAVMILCCLAIVVRIGTAVGRVLAIILWPVSIVWTIVKWMLGFA
ncbi:uncharacterized protein M437DRAFT_74973 [Aureobasidium melanogenum CBS 110374]|uniref:Uncharacterized protein n=1 Tax=Aureobasidium melanogenum (strain CBS 110374) TaxID=1043003 RepID=A0A074WL02_AURM1|nr:uncharacterized protein M437DRAFT_74973 [Aureobasidium melanogenum CBS 110374]KEQ63066.1 hypothetical protein M437DRAFT_74973 [Aureobasidium melanogenum CBS 110374]